MRAISFLSPAILLLLAPAVSFAQTDLERAAARNAADAGRAQFEKGQWADAVDSFTHAQQLVQAPPHLLYLARAQVKLGHLVEAHEAYLKITRETLPLKAPKVFQDAQRDAEHELDALEARLPSITIAVQGAPSTGVGVLMDGAELPPAMIGIPLPVNPGSHVFEAHGASAKSAPVTITSTEGSKETVMLTLRAYTPPPGAAAAPASTSGEPPPVDGSSSSKGSTLRTLSFVSFGVGAVGLGLGTYFLIKGSSSRDRANEADTECRKVPPTPDFQCGDPVLDSQIKTADKDANTQNAIGVTSLIVGGVGIATGVTLLILSSGSHSEQASTKPHVTPVFGYQSIGLVGTF